MPKVQTSGYGRFWPMKQHMGKDKNGNFLYREVFLDIKKNEVHFDVNKRGEYLGWNGNPPNGLAEEPIHSSNEAYRRGYEQIIWGNPGEKNITGGQKNG